MSVFSAVRIDAIEEVIAGVGDGLDVVDVLHSLVDKRLVRSVAAGGSHRFTMLQTIRDFADEKLQASPELGPAGRRAHATFYAIRRPPDPRPRRRPARLALEELDVEMGNLRTAWQYWVEASDLARLRSMLDALWAYHDFRGWYHGAAGLAATSSPSGDTPGSPERDEEEMTLRVSLARVLMTVHGYTVEVDAEFRRALELASRPGQRSPRPVLRALATYHLNISEYEKTPPWAARCWSWPSVRAGTPPRRGPPDDRDRVRLRRRSPGGPRAPRPAAICSPRKCTARVGCGWEPVPEWWPASSRACCAGWGDGRTGPGPAAEAVELARKLNHPYSQAYAFYHVGYLELGRRDLAAARSWAGELRAVAVDNDYPIWRAPTSVLEGVALCGTGSPTKA